MVEVTDDLGNVIMKYLVPDRGVSRVAARGLRVVRRYLDGEIGRLR